MSKTFKITLKDLRHVLLHLVIVWKLQLFKKGCVTENRDFRQFWFPKSKLAEPHFFSGRYCNDFPDDQSHLQELSFENKTRSFLQRDIRPEIFFVLGLGYENIKNFGIRELVWDAFGKRRLLSPAVEDLVKMDLLAGTLFLLTLSILWDFLRKNTNHRANSSQFFQKKHFTEFSADFRMKV